MKRNLSILVLCALAAAGLYGISHVPRLGEKALAARTQKEALPPAATVVRVAPADFNETVLVTGTLVARDEILVAPEVEGLRVLDVLVEEGARVTEGQVLATLVHETLDAQLAQNEANLNRADAAIAQAKSNIVQAEARLEEARNAFDRAKPLKQRGHLAENVFDQREAAARMAQALLTASRNGLLFAEAEKAQVEAQRRELLWRRGNTEVKAPADGLVSRRDARIGAMAAGSAEPLFRIIANGEIELDAEVPEAQLARLQAGQQGEISVAGVGDIEGRVRLVSPEVDRTTRLGRVRVSLRSDGALRIGAFGRGTITTATGRGLAVPATALLFGPGGAYVQTVSNDRVAARRVQTGLQSAGLVEIRQGLSEGDAVIATSGTFLRDGDSVRPVFANGAEISKVN
jgi:RND family efflux transporter MFP subunit